MRITSETLLIMRSITPTNAVEATNEVMIADDRNRSISCMYGFLQLTYIWETYGTLYVRYCVDCAVEQNGIAQHTIRK